MKLAFLILSIALLLSACDQKNPSSEYGDRLTAARKSAEDAALTANLGAVQKSVDAFRAANGEFPRSLKDVEGMLGGQLDLSVYDYDPQTGVVSIRPGR